MNRTLSPRFALALILLSGLPPGPSPAQTQGPRRPNVVLIMTDDQGYGDLSCHGNPVLKTPALDRLHSESVRFTNFHVDPTCAPTRAALMTGRYSERVGVWHTVMGRQILAAEEVTLAEVFRDAGYATGIFGKWHLGDHYPFRPQDQGFGESLVNGGGGVSQVPDHWGNDYFDDTYLHNGKSEKVSGYCTDVWFRAATEFVDAHKDRPFFAYIPTNAPHDPYFVPEKYAAPYQGRPDVANAAFLGMIACIDENVGRLLDHLERTGLAENTIVVFMTDNGSSAGYNPMKRVGFNDGMRGMKGSPYEGGHRVPCFVRWPAGGIGGEGKGRDISRLAAHFDLMPTLAELTGAALPEGVRLDGKSLVPLIRDPGADWPARTLVVESQRVEHPVKWRQSAVMDGRFRLINGKELFDLKADPGQHHDVAAKHGDVVSRLRSAYDRWWADISPAHGRMVRVPIGLEATGEVALTCHDWHGENPIAYQKGVRDGVVGNGYWAVEVARPGTYEFRLRRWPDEENRAINDGPGPKASRARVKVGDRQSASQVGADAVEVVLRLDLQAGPADLWTWFEGEGAAPRGAYYLYVQKVEE